MLLPNIGEPTVIYFDYKGTNIQFRKPTLAMLKNLDATKLQGSESGSAMIELLASLLYGYDEEPIESRRTFIENLEFDDATGLQGLLEQLGLNAAKKNPEPEVTAEVAQ